MIEGLGVYGGATGNTSKTKSADDTMGKDAFLKLLVTQLQNQDPLNPTDNTEFVAQLAQFSSLEGIQNLNNSFGSMKGGIDALSQFGSTSLIGKNAKVETASFRYDGQPRTLGLSVGTQAANAAVVVRDPSGRAVDQIDIGPVKAGYREVQWDGTTAAGLPAAPGLYTFTVEAKDAYGKDILSTQFVKGPVTGVSLGARSTVFMDGVEVARDLVREIY